MPDQIIEIPGVGPVAFPDSMSEQDITAAAKRLHDEANASVPQSEDGGMSFTAPLVTAAGKAAPFMVAGANSAAHTLGAAAKSKYGRLTPGLIAVNAATDVARGDLKGAAKAGALSAAATQVPRAAAAVVKATAPLSGKLPSGATFVAKKGVGGLTKAAGVASRFAGPLGLILSALLDDRRSPELRKLGETGRDQ